MKILICKDSKHFDQTAAKEIVRHLQNQPRFVLGLATGGTPQGVYHQLVKLHHEGKADFSRCTSFNLDEYVGIDPGHPQSYHYYMHHHLFSHINIQADSIHIPNGTAESIDTECEDYEKAIYQAGGIDLQVLGIGHNGHIGFNEPGTPFGSQTHTVQLTQRTLEANARFFESADQVPTQAITMGIKTIMRAHRIILLVKGSDKAEILLRSLYGPVTSQVPASILQLHPSLLLIADQEASVHLVKKSFDCVG